jgi:ABC-2 type transport system permease protein
MTVNLGQLTIARRSVIVGISQLRGNFTWRTWLFGWLVRVIFQVFFFSLLGRYMGSPDLARYLLLGAAAGVAMLEAMPMVLETASDRMYGMMPLLVAAPGDYFVVYLARKLNVVGMGVVSSSLAMFIAARVASIPLSFPRALLFVPLVTMGAVSTYLFASFLGAIVARVAQIRWLAINIGFVGLTALCGFSIPVGFWPAPVSAFAEILPFTHVLRVIRALIADGRTTDATVQCALELLVALGWLTVSWLVFRISIHRSRWDGRIDLAG